ncbi:DUF2835 domain-containing protein [Bacterioplanoides pacificum]|uniref:DUF2835 domain-containing protein n=1 Tax=Bacterioplanoides pacificum TaxID=1171596 RepID=A0ABV7VR43_9GAMM
MSDLSVVVELAISGDELLRYYNGSARLVSAIASDGRRVQFPASVLQKVVSHDGVYGRFRIDFSQQGKFLGITRLA